MSLYDELLADIIAAGPGPNQIVTPAGVHPRGWEPGVTWNGRDGYLNTGPLNERPNDWSKLLQVWDLDPLLFEVVEPVEFRAYDANLGGGDIQRMYYYKAKIISRRNGFTMDCQEMIDEIKGWKAPRAPAVSGGPLSFIWMIADLQVGKSDGDGTPGTMRRFMLALDSIVARVKDLRRLGRPIGTLYVCGVGDCIENVEGHYPQQAFRADLNLTQQVRVIRRLLVTALKKVAHLFERVVIAAIPGNHGEVRSNGKSFTDFSDNWDVECFIQAHEVISENPAFKHVDLVVPQGQELTLTLDMSGTIVTLAHGHQFRGGKSPAMQWWANQAHGLQQAGMSTLLLSGHLHHLRVEQQGFKTFIQAPALDGGSDWWRNATGQVAPTGTVTMVVGAGTWGDFAVL